MADSALKKKTTDSLFWSFLDKFGQQILNFASMLILMNIVAAEEYGLVGSLAVFIAFSSILIDSGFGRVLLNRKELHEGDYATVFYFNVSLSIILYLLFFISAPLLARMFHAPAITNIVRILFISLIFNAFGLIHQTLLTKNANFRGLTQVNTLALLLSGVTAVVMAIAGYGVWSLVAQTLLYAFFRSLFLWSYSPWRPTARFNWKSLRSFFAFGNKLLATSVITTTVNNIYPSLIATFYPMNQVAYFNQAKKYQEIPFLTLGNAFRSVAMLILSEINEQHERLKRVVSKIIKSIAFLAFPIGFIMIAIAEPVFYLLFKEKWLPAVPYFQILTFAGMLSPFIHIFQELFIAKENARYFLGIELIKGVILVVLILLLFPHGIAALAISWIIYTVVSLLISVILAGRVIRYTLLHLIKDIGPYLVLAAISSAAAYLTTRKIDNNALFILFNLVIAPLLYIFICKLVKLEMLKEIEYWFEKRKQEKR